METFAFYENLCISWKPLHFMKTFAFHGNLCVLCKPLCSMKTLVFHEKLCSFQKCLNLIVCRKNGHEGPLLICSIYMGTFNCNMHWGINLDVGPLLKPRVFNVYSSIKYNFPITLCSIKLKCYCNPNRYTFC